ncbi:MAG: DegV family protein [Anaerolineae bacterium]
MIAIVTDSTCDLPASLRASYDFAVIPAHVIFNSDDFLDGVTIDAEVFYRRIRDTGIIPTTSQPSIGEFVQLYRELAAKGADEILSLHISRHLSGMVGSAEMAASEVAGEIKVHVFDSSAGSVGLGYMVVEAAEAVKIGRSAEDILAVLKRIRESLTIVLAPLNLEFLLKSGRISRLQGALGTLLNIKPIVQLKDGTLEATERVRSRRKSLQRMVEITAETHGSQPVNVGVAHASAPDDAQSLLSMAEARLNCQQAFTTELGLGITSHLGPGTVGLGAYPSNAGMLP